MQTLSSSLRFAKRGTLRSRFISASLSVICRVVVKIAPRLMLKFDGNRTLAHSGGNELDHTVTHVVGYLPARLAQLVIRTAHSSQRMLPCLPLFAVHTGAWPAVRFGARAFG